MEAQISYRKEVRAAGQWHPLKKDDGTDVIVRTYSEYAEQINDIKNQTGMRLVEVKKAEPVIKKDDGIVPEKPIALMNKQELLDKCKELDVEVNGSENKVKLGLMIKNKIAENKKL